MILYIVHKTIEKVRNSMISESVLDFLMEISVLSFVFPVVILLTWRLRTTKNLLPALWGVLVFIFFAKLLETIPYAIFVGYDNPVSRFIRSNELIYAVYQGFMAAIFEEAGRFLVFRYFITGEKFDNRQTAITYGIGHGGAECMVVLGWTYLQYYMSGIMLNNQTTRKEMSARVLEEMTEQFSDFTSLSLILNGVAQIAFFAMQIGLSIIVYQGVRNVALRKRLLGYAMGLHLISYLPNGCYHAGWLPQPVALALIILVTLVTLFLAGGIYRKMGEAEKEKKAIAKKNGTSPQAKNWSFAKKKLTNIEHK